MLNISKSELIDPARWSLPYFFIPKVTLFGTIGMGFIFELILWRKEPTRAK